jgi:hypothetical protein
MRATVTAMRQSVRDALSGTDGLSMTTQPIGGGWFIYGPPRTGKSHLIGAVINEVVEQVPGCGVDITVLGSFNEYRHKAFRGQLGRVVVVDDPRSDLEWNTDANLHKMFDTAFGLGQLLIVGSRDDPGVIKSIVEENVSQEATVRFERELNQQEKVGMTARAGSILRFEALFPSDRQLDVGGRTIEGSGMDGLT